MKKIFIAISLCLASSAAAKTTITFEEQAVVATVTPGAKTAWFAVVHEWKGYGLRLVERATLLADDDRDGIVRLNLGRSAARESVWMVVDLASGDSAVEAPPGMKLHRRPLPAAALHSRASDRAAHVAHKATFSIVWLVRPGVGAWMSAIDDGNASDGDGTFDGSVEAALERMTPVGDSPAPPDDFRRDDVVAAIAPLTLEIFDGRVAR